MDAAPINVLCFQYDIRRWAVSIPMHFRHFFHLHIPPMHRTPKSVICPVCPQKQSSPMAREATAREPVSTIPKKTEPFTEGLLLRSQNTIIFIAPGGRPVGAGAKG